MQLQQHTRRQGRIDYSNGQKWTENMEIWTGQGENNHCLLRWKQGKIIN